MQELQDSDMPAKPGLYILSQEPTKKLYVGETLDLRSRLILKRQHVAAWQRFADSILVHTLPMDCSTAGKLAWQSCLVKRLKPSLNCFELRSA